ncbi:MAG: DUF692 domain-containing protein [Deltaproteobacteria bacterium]|nr:DUF692 domain-containing protein [Deltaproteobacteria bacterium]
MALHSHLGHGIGLRPPHYPHVLDGSARADWFEIISENFMVAGGRVPAVLEAARRQAPIVLHGVSMSLGGVDPLNERYLGELKQLIERIEPAWVSDHLCWGGFGRHYAHDLLPLPFTEEALAHVAARIRYVQDRLGCRILIENVSSYVTFTHSALPEWEFLAGVAEAADCGILLDVNNIYVSSVNHGFDAQKYLAGVPVERVGQIHLAGHQNNGTHLIDTHDHPVPSPVWDLYRDAIRRVGPVSTLIERDDNIPELSELLAEAEMARQAEAEAIDGAVLEHGTWSPSNPTPVALRPASL